MKSTETRLSNALLGYFILVIALLTLNPFYLAMPGKIRFAFSSDLTNLISNILLFLPIGFFYHLSTRKRGAFLVGAIVSISIEIIQIFIPARTPSIVDILANTLGAGFGAALHDFLSVRIAISQGTIGRLRLETPLMGVAYLLTALLWADSLTLANQPNKLLLTALLGLCGTIIISELFRHWWEKIDYRISGYAALAAGFWFFLGISPALWNINIITMMEIAVMALTAALALLPKNKSERRFEQTTLKWIFPIFGIYLILLAIWEPFRPLTDWHWVIGFTNQITETSMDILMPRIEYLIAFTVLGYLLAEWRGRSEVPLQKDILRLFLISTGIALGLEFFVGFQIGSGASLIRIVMGIISALFGGTIYHLLRAHIRFLLRQ
jgi:VanZ family protein